MRIRKRQSRQPDDSDEYEEVSERDDEDSDDDEEESDEEEYDSEDDGHRNRPQAKKQGTANQKPKTRHQRLSSHMFNQPH